MKNLSGLMKQAQQMQEKMQEVQSRLESMEVHGEAGAGLVSVTMNGKGDLRQVRIDPKVIDPADAEMLQDLIVAAHANARQKVEAAAAAEMQKVAGGMQLPPGMKLPF
jgi:DNA-binding YbaB/EbfC family protein